VCQQTAPAHPLVLHFAERTKNYIEGLARQAMIL
jgi:hypothetical protein